MLIRRLALLIGAIALITFGIVPAAAQAAEPALRINDSYRWEYVTECRSTCGTYTQTMEFLFDLYPRKSFPVTVNYEIVDITTTAGQDYMVATTGTITLAANTSQAHLLVPVVNDGVAEPTETFRLRATSISVSADISDTGTGTIYDGGNIPPDCTLSRIDVYAGTYAIACTGRPAGQQWVHRATCMFEFAMFRRVDGNVVTGNGTSTASCDGDLYQGSSFVALS